MATIAERDVRRQEVRRLLNTIQASWICGEEIQKIVEAIDRIYTKENVEVKTKRRNHESK